MKSWWSRFWALWGISGLTVELVGVFRKAKGDTLSEQVWWIRDHYAHWSMLSFLMAGFFGWLVYHFTFEGRPHSVT